MKEEGLKVVIVEPGKPARIAVIGTELEDMQAAVGGYIEVIHPFDTDRFVIVCNEEGRLDGSHFNRVLMREPNRGIELFGTFFIVGTGGEEFVSLTDEQADRFKRMFLDEDAFIYVHIQEVIQ